VVLASLVAASPALAEDDWLGEDKPKHAIISGTLAGGVSMVTLTQTRSRFTPYLLGGGFALGLGVAKEGWDAAGHGTASYRDLAWDVIGTAVGLGLTLAVDLLVGRD